MLHGMCVHEMSVMIFACDGMQSQSADQGRALIFDQCHTLICGLPRLIYTDLHNRTDAMAYEIVGFISGGSGTFVNDMQLNPKHGITLPSTPVSVQRWFL